MNTSSLNEDHLSAQIAKLMAETAKINTEARWYPWVVIAGVFAAALAVARLFL